MEQNQFPKLWDMAKEAFAIYKQKILQILAIMAGPFVLQLIIGFLVAKIFIDKGVSGELAETYLSTLSMKEIFSLLVEVAIKLSPVLFLAFIVGTICSFAMVIFIIKRNQNFSIKDSIMDSASKFFKVLWTGILLCLAVMFGFILFIIPGIIFMIWFTFSGSILADQGLAGTKALSKSKQYVSGLMGKIFGKIAGMMFWSTIFGMAISFLPDLIENIAMGIFTSPMIMIIMVLLYERVKQIKEQNNSPEISI